MLVLRRLVPGLVPRLAPFARHALALAVASMCVSASVACDKRSDASESSAPLPPLKPGEIRVVASEHGFTPGSVDVPKGAAGSTVTLSFVRTTDQTCATEVVFPDLDIKKPLPLNQAVAVNVPSDAARSLTFQCGMGMYKGAVLVK
jgi:plastocyanin domain-containing protein